MAFIELPTPEGEQILLLAGGVHRVTSSADAKGGAATRVECGPEAPHTSLTVSEVVDRLRSAGALLIELTRSEGNPVFLSVPAVTSVRDVNSGGDPPGTRAVVTVAGHRQAVRETRHQVRSALENGGV